MKKAKVIAQSRTSLAVFVAVALVLTGAFLAPDAGASPKEPVLAKASLVWPDGLNHFVLTPASIAPKTSVTSTEELPEGAVLTHDPSGKALALLKDGRLLTVGQKITTVAAQDKPVTLVGGTRGRNASDVFAKTVEAWPGVTSVKPIGGGLVSIATSLDKTVFEKKAEVGRVDTDELLQLGSVATGTPNDAQFASQWMHDNTGNPAQAGNYAGTVDADTDAPQAWSRTTGAGVIVADLDSGVQTNHPDLAANLWHNTADSCGNNTDDDNNGYVDDCNGWDAADNDNNPNPDVGGSFGGHGTHVAGIIGATADNGIGVAGMAPGSRVMAVKIGSGANLSTGSILAATMYAVDNGAKIINASWGSAPGTPREYAYVMEQAVAYAQQHGVLYVVAAGNDGTNIDVAPTWPASFSQFYDNVLTVGASTNSDTRASFSNYGSTTVDLFAPGWFINSTFPGNAYAMMSGTSMASPAVAGAAALVASANPSWNASQIRQRLRTTVDDIPALAGYSATSRINASTAVGAANDPFTVDFSGFDAVRPDTPFDGTAVITTTDAALAAQASKLVATVVTTDGGLLYNVADLPLDITVNGTSTSVTTDEDGQAVVSGLSLASAATVTIDGSLPEGDYALMLQAAESNGDLLGNGSTVFFSVAEPVDNGPSSSGGSSSGSGGSSGGAGNSSGSSGSAGDAPAGDSPAGSGGAVAPGDTSGSAGSSGSSGSTSGGSTSNDGPSDSGGGAPGDAPASDTNGGGSSSGSNSSPSGGSGDAGSSGGSSGASGGGPAPTTQPSEPDFDPDAPMAPVVNGSWEITSISPRQGDEAGGAMLLVYGRFPTPSSVNVKLGGLNAEVLYAATWTLLVRTPAHVPGIVDFIVTAPGMTLTSPNAFRYTTTAGAASGGTSGSSGSAGNSGSSAGDGSSTADNAGGSGDTSITPSPVTPEPGSGGSAGGSSGSSGSGGSGQAGGAQVKQRGDLRLIPRTGSSPLGAIANSAWPGANCTRDTCRGIAVRG